MEKKEAMYYALGMLKGYNDSGKDYMTVKLKNIFDDKYEDYEIGVSLHNIVLMDVSQRVDGRLRRVIEVSEDFNAEQIVNLMLEALAYDMKNNKK